MTHAAPRCLTIISKALSLLPRKTFWTSFETVNGYYHRQKVSLCPCFYDRRSTPTLWRKTSTASRRRCNGWWVGCWVPTGRNGDTFRTLVGREIYRKCRLLAPYSHAPVHTGTTTEALYCTAMQNTTQTFTLLISENIFDFRSQNVARANLASNFSRGQICKGRLFQSR